ncbi:MAG: neutral/alkaline non-lysosomal ceramidase N-terminal domain-containing protein, partial [Actinomycetota bacterium]
MHGITKLVAVPIALLLTMGLVPLASGALAQEHPCRGVLCAGAASVDMTWHVGAGQGQYGSEGNGLTSDKFDPFHHQTKMVPTDGMQSRTYAKAIVIQGADGTKIVYVKTDLYLQQDLLTRRVAELVAGDPIAPEYAVEGLDGEHIMIGTTHNHSAPEYASTAFGVWLFTDTFDFRMFEDTARDVARAIKEADAALTPAKIGASVTRFDEVQQNILGPGTADDGTPAGFPRDHFDDELTVIRVDRADGSGPIAAWANLGMHPESQDTTDLISADFTGMVERMVERGMGRRPGAAEGPVVAWSQGSVGDVEPDQSRANPPEAGREYWHRNYAQMELMSRQVAAAVLDTWGDVAAGTPDVPEKFVTFAIDVPVGMVDYRFAGPPSHPLPTVSNCRTERPGAPIVGLPNCARADEELDDQLKPPEQYGTTLKLLRDAGIPIPGNYSPTSYEGVQESLRIHLQAIRLGDILLASCPCEPVSDMTLNLKSRADAQNGMYFGYQWPCEERADGLFCNFATAAWRDPDWRQVDPAAYQLMQAQITNPADGWEDDVASLQGEVEPTDPTQIYGNYTHREIQDLPCGDNPCEGYKLPVMVGQANDYVGYIVTYREYQRGDHYRKALTAFGPHTSDYINTRLVQMGAELKGGAAPSAT